MSKPVIETFTLPIENHCEIIEVKCHINPLLLFTLK
jgi:hypothetical protein